MQRVMLGTPACAMTRVIAKHGCLESHAWWNATGITPASLCGRLETKPVTGQFTTLPLRGFVRLIHRVRFTTKARCSMRGGIPAVLQQVTWCAQCMPPLTTLLNTGRTVLASVHSSCANTAMPWATQMGRCPIIGTHSKTLLVCRVVLCGNGKTTA